MPNWFSFMCPRKYTWWLILLNNNFSSTFPHVSSRLMGRNLDGSSLSAFPGLVIDITISILYLCGNVPLRRHPLYMAVMYLGKISTILLKTSLGMQTSLVPYFYPLIATFFTSCTVYSLSWSVSMSSCVNSRVFFCISVSFSWLSSGVSICSLWWIVSWRFVVIVPSFCFSVVWGAVRLSLPASILYIPLHLSVIEVIVQYSFQDVYLSFLIAAAYSAFVARYCSFRWSSRTLLSFVCWNFCRCAFKLFPQDCKVCVHQGTDLCDIALCAMFLILNEVLQAVSRASWSSSITVSVLGAAATLWLSCLSSPSIRTISLFIPLRSRSNICMRFPWNFAMSLCSTLYLKPPLLFPVGWIIAFALPRSYFIMTWSEQLSWSCIAHPLMRLIAWLFRIVNDRQFDVASVATGPQHPVTAFFVSDM